MKYKSWHINRRELLKGGGVALALPLLDGMGKAMEVASKIVPAGIPKRMLVSYFAYGAYMPNGTNGLISSNLKKDHHDWSWWPCKDAGPLTFNKSSAPFASFKNQISYFRGLDHAGGWALGGHSSGDVFGTGADMVGTQKTNSISIDQVAATRLVTILASRHSCSARKAVQGHTAHLKPSLTAVLVGRSLRCTSPRRSLIGCLTLMPEKVSSRSAPD